VGVKPDVLVETTNADVAAGRDGVLEKAQEILREAKKLRRLSTNLQVLGAGHTAPGGNSALRFDAKERAFSRDRRRR
jgi:hypothetical protein